MRFFKPESENNKNTDLRSSIMNKLDEFDSRLKVQATAATNERESIKQLSGLDLSGSHQVKADFVGADLGGANLQKANLSGAKLIGANLTDANLHGAILTNANLSFAYLEGAQLNGAKLDSFCCFDAFLRGVQLNYVEIPHLIRAYYERIPIDPENPKDINYFAKIMQLRVLDKLIK